MHLSMWEKVPREVLVPFWIRTTPLDLDCNDRGQEWGSRVLSVSAEDKHHQHARSTHLYWLYASVMPKLPQVLPFATAISLYSRKTQLSAVAVPGCSLMLSPGVNCGAVLTVALWVPGYTGVMAAGRPWTVCGFRLMPYSLQHSGVVRYPDPQVCGCATKIGFNTTAL